MEKRDHLKDNESEARPGSGVSPGNDSLGTRSDISSRPATSVLDPMWALLGVTGCHP
jgi:hypothetical protein